MVPSSLLPRWPQEFHVAPRIKQCLKTPVAVWITDGREDMDGTDRIVKRDKRKEYLQITYLMSRSKGKASGWSRMSEL